jgi:trigger factor
MDITEVTTEGLRRELKVVVGADELERRLSARLDDLNNQVKTGASGRAKAHAQVYGCSVMAVVVQQAVKTSWQPSAAAGCRLSPNITAPEDEKEIEQIFPAAPSRLYHVLRGAAQIRQHGFRQDRR